jgi:hypothetical protein
MGGELPNQRPRPMVELFAFILIEVIGANRKREQLKSLLLAYENCWNAFSLNPRMIAHEIPGKHGY